ncbi:MAG: hypothetical protein IJ748_07475 [Bacteroidales bacterium]|nr:hypothetical protein [Bacteroidales bacterium]
MELTVNNPADEDILLRHKEGLTRYLKNKLSYKFLKLEIILDNQQKKIKPYNAVEKYTAIVNNNPAVSKLKEVFDADIKL